MKTNAVLSVVLLFGASASLNADVMVYDRGLPTAGINDPVSAARSNVAWGDYSPWNGTNWATGDDFALGTPTTITDLRVWIVGTDNQALSAMWSDLTLFGGDTSSVGVLATADLNASHSNVVLTPVTDPTYTGSSGATIKIWQVDFLLNWAVDGGLHTFFVGGTPTGTNIGLYGNGVSPFLHASNKDLSGSPQQGADNLYRELNYTSGATPSFISMDTWNSDGSATTGDGQGGWDKSSDINVQIFATPEPGSIVLLGTLLIGISVGLRRKRTAV